MAWISLIMAGPPGAGRGRAEHHRSRRHDAELLFRPQGIRERLDLRRGPCHATADCHQQSAGRKGLGRGPNGRRPPPRRSLDVRTSAQPRLVLREPGRHERQCHPRRAVPRLHHGVSDHVRSELGGRLRLAGPPVDAARRPRALPTGPHLRLPGQPLGRVAVLLRPACRGGRTGPSRLRSR